MDKFMRMEEASEYLKSKYGIEIRPSTLATWRSRGKGPKHVKKFGKVYYTAKMIDDFVKKGE